MAVITQGFLDKMRKRMFNKMQALPIKYFDAHGHGDIMSHYTNDIDTLRQLVSQSLPRILQSGVPCFAAMHRRLHAFYVGFCVKVPGVIPKRLLIH